MNIKKNRFIVFVLVLIIMVLLAYLGSIVSKSEPIPATAASLQLETQNAPNEVTAAKSGTVTSVKTSQRWLGNFESTAYGPPWDAMNGTSITSTGVELSGEKCIVAVDPEVIPYHTKLALNPDPHPECEFYLAEDTGGAIVGNRIDFYDWHGREHQYDWGVRNVSVFEQLD